MLNINSSGRESMDADMDIKVIVNNIVKSKEDVKKDVVVELNDVHEVKDVHVTHDIQQIHEHKGLILNTNTEKENEDDYLILDDDQLSKSYINPSILEQENTDFS